MNSVLNSMQAVKGMNDILPPDTQKWRHIENIIIDCIMQYGYEEIRLPLLEQTLLFNRTIGEITDIVEKEMYTFNDLNGDSLTLRPEGTASCVRACIEHGLLRQQLQKFWYYGSMFRHEKPQKGRYRQFNQFGLEAFGIVSYAIEIELIMVCERLWNILGINNVVQLEINTLGNLTDRQIYKNRLLEFLNKNIQHLDEHSALRLKTNPLRILDSKDENVRKLLLDAPKIIDVLSHDSKLKFMQLCDCLDALKIKYSINHCLVRGLDYYEHTVFEWTTAKLGSQATICAGGRYDKLIEQLGGKSTPAVGLAIGMERLMLLINEVKIEPQFKLFFIFDSDITLQRSLLLADKLRNVNVKWQVIINIIGGSFKNQFKKADKSCANFAIIIGKNELESATVCVKNLRKKEEQIVITENDLINYLLSVWRN